MEYTISLILINLIPILLVIISYRIWKKYGKDYEVVDTIEFYPPDNLNSLELAFIVKGKVSKKDVISLLIYLASKGYIKIIEDGKSYIILKQKEYDGDNLYEQIFFDNLFKNGNYSFEYNTIQVTTKELFNKFYQTISEIKHKISSEKRNFVYEKTFFKSLSILIFIMITLITIVVIPRITYFGFYKLSYTLKPILTLCFLYFLFFMTKFPYYIKVFLNIFLFITIMISEHCFYIDKILIDNSAYLYSFIFGIICIIIMFIILDNMIKRSKYNSELLGKVYGFKRFLEHAEKPRIEALIEQDPDYFYKIMPYVYVLNVSDKWIKKFEKVSYQMPDWFNYIVDNDVKKIINIINELLNIKKL